MNEEEMIQILSEDQSLNESEEVEFDDFSAVDYDLDYTVQY
jgi:hypothetical protein